ncbi:transcription factor bHLH153-like isoform X2 [Curcuma longa]|uniref:transcription factor bHLH153-like isoform X2 n=1 Tax=Curcuma longa TaxID=136217 RepID=UPI003D9F7CB4
MMAEMVDHKRRRSCSRNNSFVLRNLAGEKRLKTAIPAKKDKVGERVAKLQQLVSPFGKTDAASVLAEATAYIKFLQEQVRVLSAPYLETTMAGKMEESDHYSLRRRSLCLVPIDSIHKLAQSNGADLWAPVNARKKTTKY